MSILFGKHIGPFAHHLAEPRLLVIVEPPQIVGSHIRKMLACIVDHAEIHKGAGSQVHDPKRLSEVFLLNHLLVRVRVSNGRQNGDSFFQKKIHRLGLRSGSVLDLFLHLGPVHLKELAVNDGPEREKRSKRYEQGNQDDISL